MDQKVIIFTSWIKWKTLLLILGCCMSTTTLASGNGVKFELKRIENGGVLAKWEVDVPKWAVSHFILQKAASDKTDKIADIQFEPDRDDLEYTFIDNNASLDLTYYILEIYNLDGIIVHSEIQQVDPVEGEMELTIYPVPLEHTRDDLYLSFTNVKMQSEVRVQIVDIEGRNYYQSFFKLAPGDEKVKLVLPASMDTGYYLTYVSCANTQVLKFKKSFYVYD